MNKHKIANIKCPDKCKQCKYHKIFTHCVKPYNFCKVLNHSFCGEEPEWFFNCEEEKSKVEKGIIKLP